MKKKQPKTLRSLKFSQELRKNISTILQHQIKDPRISKTVLISDVIVSNDLIYTKIFFTIFEYKNQEKIKITLKGLKNSSKYIRYLLGKSMHLRILPELKFFYDYSLTNGINISNILSNLLRYEKDKK
ncbi:30S ribosome-binding factor RbfA [Candidatus Tachikawaea gelatinosa]|uniref:Ribosome-binding factor A n=1 Tax=Candidatus Tachikawaea gelatinosa TaxID=1410383 RepID=A0A090BWD9_9ENTR|nr:30S ribosome-binding factor RbfA [Candidatus Tachikawaea gelatinosa]BAP58436.1 ribosome-binding factor A [Candidatus Tachikawaea gelatinosa]